jgi:hypothetical protein
MRGSRIPALEKSILVIVRIFGEQSSVIFIPSSFASIMSNKKPEEDEYERAVVAVEDAVDAAEQGVRQHLDLIIRGALSLNDVGVAVETLIRDLIELQDVINAERIGPTTSKKRPHSNVGGGGDEAQSSNAKASKSCEGESTPSAAPKVVPRTTAGHYDCTLDAAQDVSVIRVETGDSIRGSSDVHLYVHLEPPTTKSLSPALRIIAEANVLGNVTIGHVDSGSNTNSTFNSGGSGSLNVGSQTAGVVRNFFGNDGVHTTTTTTRGRGGVTVVQSSNGTTVNGVNIVDSAPITFSLTGDVHGNVTTHGAYQVSCARVLGNVNTQSGNVEVAEQVSGSVSTQSGDVRVGGDVKNSAKTMSGDVHVGGNLGGDASTMSGDVTIAGKRQR